MCCPSILWERVPSALRTSAPDILGDLNLDQVLAEIVAGREQYGLLPYFYTLLETADEVSYRHAVFKDLADSAVAEGIQAFSRGMQTVREYGQKSEKVPYRRQREAWFLDAVGLYCDTVLALEQTLALGRIEARALLRMGDYVHDYVTSQGFAPMQHAWTALKADLGSIAYCLTLQGSSIEVGHKCDPRDYAEDLAVLFSKFGVAPANPESTAHQLEPLEMNHVEAAILDRVAELYPEPFGRLRDYCGRYADYIDPGVRQLDRELQFYLAYQEHSETLKSHGLEVCYPQIATHDQAKWARSTYDVALAQKLLESHQPLVTNDFRLDKGESILVVTGPNQGGKTTFARGIGQLHFLAALGLPVPGQEVQVPLCDQIFTHFEHEEDVGRGQGKLQDELERMFDILARASSASLIIINESFNATTLHDALLLSTEIVDRIIELDALAVVVTFLDELASYHGKTVSMVAGIDPQTGERTYKVSREPASGMAYALSLAERHGLTYGQIKERSMP